MGEVLVNASEAVTTRWECGIPRLGPCDITPAVSFRLSLSIGL